MSPVFQSRNVTFGRSDTSTFGEGRRKTCAPGMVRSRFGWQSFFLESQIKLFGRNNFRLPCLLVASRSAVASQLFARTSDGLVQSILFRPILAHPFLHAT